MHVTRVPVPGFRIARIAGRALGGGKPDGPARRRQPADPGARRALDVQLALQAASGVDPGLRRRRARYHRAVSAQAHRAAGEAALILRGAALPWPGGDPGLDPGTSRHPVVATRRSRFALTPATAAVAAGIPPRRTARTGTRR